MLHWAQYVAYKKMCNISRVLLKHLLLSTCLLIYSTNGFAIGEPAFRTAVIAGITTTFLVNPYGARAVAIENGYSIDDKDLYAARLSNRWKVREGLVKTNYYRLDSFVYFGIGQWRLGLFSDEGANYSRHELTNNVYDLYSAFRHQWAKSPFYIETSLGVAFFSTRQLANTHYGSHGQFVSGLIFGVEPLWERFALQLKIQHYSDNDFSDQNPGENIIFFSIERLY